MYKFQKNERFFCIFLYFSYRGDWKYAFEPRNLIGLSVEPLLVFPTHYTGEPNYISDTEDSNVIKKGTTPSAKEPSLAKINTIPTGTSNDVKEEL